MYCILYINLGNTDRTNVDFLLLLWIYFYDYDYYRYYYYFNELFAVICLTIMFPYIQRSPDNTFSCSKQNVINHKF